MSRIAIKTDRVGFKDLCVDFLIKALKDEDVGEGVENIWANNGDEALLDVPQLDPKLYLQKQAIEVLVDNIVQLIACDHYYPVEADMKVDVDGENYDFLKILDINGTVGFLMDMGGDWECPVQMFVYFDQDKKLRIYIPPSATYNHTTKSAYGNADDEEDDNKDFVKYVKKHFPFWAGKLKTTDDIWMNDAISNPDAVWDKKLFEHALIKDITKRIVT